MQKNLDGLLPKCIFKIGIVLQYWILYCRDLGLKGKIVLQGQVLYRDIGSLASWEVSCDTACWTHSRRAGTAWARGARSRSAGTALGSRLGRAWTGAERADGLAGRARGRAAGPRGAQGARGTTGRCSRRGRARGALPGRGWALGARPRCAGWPGLCTQCTRLDFQTGLSTLYFS